MQTAPNTIRKTAMTTNTTAGDICEDLVKNVSDSPHKKTDAMNLSVEGITYDILPVKWPLGIARE